jgi:hypothetical protein
LGNAELGPSVVAGGGHRVSVVEVGRLVVRRFGRRRRVRGVAVAERQSAETLSPEAFRRIVEERVRDRFDMSLTEFADAFRAGKLDGDPAAYDLAVVSGASTRRY